MPSVSALGPDELRAAADRMAAYLSRVSGPNGRFRYRVNLDPTVAVKPRYNELRHAGTVYALAQAAAASLPAADLATVSLPAEYLKREILGPCGDGMIGAWSRSEVTGEEGRPQAKLGGAGLAIVALTSLERVGPGSTPLDLLRGLGRFVLWMQKPDGSFYSKFDPSAERRDDDFVSLYYPGEAALGLVMLSELDPDPAWAAGAIRALAYLARSRRGEPSVEADHWALLATGRLLGSPIPPAGSEMDDDLLISHAMQVVESMLAERIENPPGSLVHGCWAIDGRTTPTATRVEGLLAILPTIAGRDGELAARMTQAVEDGIQFLLRAQISGGRYDGGIPRAIAHLPPRHPDFSPAFNARVTEIRIDYVQHVLTAVLERAHQRSRSDP